VFLPREYPEEAVRRFLCDAMLGGLAKWLRAAGHDAYYAREGTDISDAHLVRVAIAEGRTLLTSDRGFLERKPVRDGEVAFLLVPDAPVERQLRLVAEEFGLERRPSRCMGCNGVLEKVPQEAVDGSVPPRVAEGQEDFFSCGGCGRVFWHGSHWDRIGDRLRRVFGRSSTALGA
jgi:uncharacterized protein